MSGILDQPIGPTPPPEDDRPGLDVEDDPTVPEAVSPDVIAPELDRSNPLEPGLL